MVWPGGRGPPLLQSSSLTNRVERPSRTARLADVTLRKETPWGGQRSTVVCFHLIELRYT